MSQSPFFLSLLPVVPAPGSPDLRDIDVTENAHRDRASSVLLLMAPLPEKFVGDPKFIGVRNRFTIQNFSNYKS